MRHVDIRPRVGGRRAPRIGWQSNIAMRFEVFGAAGDLQHE